MEDFPIHKAVEELITIIFLDQKRQFVCDKFSIVLDIKSCKTKDDHSQSQLFKIKLFTVRSISDISTYLKAGFIKTLQFVMEKMQFFVKNESHLCQIEMSHLNSSLALQRNYFFIRNRQNKTTDLSEITQNTNKRLENQVTWYLRIYQNHLHMMRECSKILDFLKKLQILNPSDEFKYKLNVSGIKCNPDLSANSYIEICDKKIVVGLHEDFKLNQRNTYIGTTMPLTISIKGNIHQDIFTLTCLGFVYENSKKHQNLVQFFSFGPNGEPLKIPQAIINFISWEKYGQKVSLCSSFENTNITLKPEVCLIMQPNDRNILKCQTFGIIIYMMFDVTDKRHIIDLHILGFLYNNLNSVFKANEGNLRTALESLTNIIFEIDTSNQENTKEGDCLSISKSIANIVRSSTNEDFRENCLLAMKSSTMQEMQSTIAKKLKNL